MASPTIVRPFLFGGSDNGLGGSRSSADNPPTMRHPRDYGRRMCPPPSAHLPTPLEMSASALRDYVVSNRSRFRSNRRCNLDHAWRLTSFLNDKISGSGCQGLRAVIRALKTVLEMDSREMVLKSMASPMSWIASSRMLSSKYDGVMTISVNPALSMEA